MSGGRPLQYRSVRKMQRVIDLYFAKVALNRNPKSKIWAKLEPNQREIDWFDMIWEDRPLVTGLALALDLSRQGLINYEGRPAFVDTVKRAKARVEAFTEAAAQSGNAAGAIFSLKNNFNWKDERTANVAIKTHEDYLQQLDDNSETGTDG